MESTRTENVNQSLRSRTTPPPSVSAPPLPPLPPPRSSLLRSLPLLLNPNLNQPYASLGFSHPPEFCMISSEKKTVKNLEQHMAHLEEYEDNLERQCDQIGLSLTTNINTHIALVFASSVVGFIIANGSTLYYVLGIISLTFCTGVGLAIFVAFSKLLNIKKRMEEIEQRRRNLRRAAEKHLQELNQEDAAILMTPTEATVGISSGKKLLQDIIESLQIENGNFKKDHMDYLIWISISSFICLIAARMFLYVMVNRDTI